MIGTGRGGGVTENEPDAARRRYRLLLQRTVKSVNRLCERAHNDLVGAAHDSSRLPLDGWRCAGCGRWRKGHDRFCSVCGVVRASEEG